MATTRGKTQRTRPAGTLLLALALAFAGCSSAQPQTPEDVGGTGGAPRATGGKGGATGGTGGANPGMGSGGGGGVVAGTGGTAGSGGAAVDASPGPTDDGGAMKDAGDAVTGTMEDASTPPTDAPPAVMRPEGMGQACKTAANENFTVTAFDEPRTGIFTAWFSVTPSIAPTNSVVGLSDGDVGPGSGDTPLHNLHQILVRFGASGDLDARNGAMYMAASVIKYQAIQYDFRIVVDVPGKTYSAYVSWKGQPEITIGTNFVYRDTARPATKFDHWGVHAVSAKTTVCGFITRAN